MVYKQTAQNGSQSHPINSVYNSIKKIGETNHCNHVSSDVRRSPRPFPRELTSRSRQELEDSEDFMGLLMGYERRRFSKRVSIKGENVLPMAVVRPRCWLRLPRHPYAREGSRS